MAPTFKKIACSAMSPTEVSTELGQLEQVLLKRLPESVHMLVLCRLARQTKFPENCLTQFFRYVNENDGDLKDQDPFIVCIQEPNLFAIRGIIVLAPPVITPEMKQAFDSFIDWETPQVFQSPHERFAPILQDLCKAQKNLNPIDSEGIPIFLMAIPDLEKAKGLDVPCDPTVEIRSLKEEDVAEIIQNWTWAKSQSAGAIKDGLKVLPSCGAFSSEGGELASYIMLSPLGFLDVLHTPEKFRRKGNLVLRRLSKEVAIELGIHPMAEVEIWNEPSKRLFEKAGYQLMYRTRWIYFNPPQND